MRLVAPTRGTGHRMQGHGDWRGLAQGGRWLSLRVWAIKEGPRWWL